jgi:hypothetical protein
MGVRQLSFYYPTSAVKKLTAVLSALCYVQQFCCFGRFITPDRGLSAYFALVAVETLEISASFEHKSAPSCIAAKDTELGLGSLLHDA